LISYLFNYSFLFI